MSETPFMNVKEVAFHLRKSTRSIYQMVSNRAIPFRRAGGTLLFHRDEIDRWTAEQVESSEQKLGTLKVAGIR